MVEKNKYEKKFRICIPTAGVGSRIKEHTNGLNKSLIPINNKAAISHIINLFPNNCEFVIPIGYKGNLVKQYLQLAHPKKKFFFVKIKNYDLKGSGLGLTLLDAKKYLQCPFIFISCDTLIKGKIDLKPDHNWVGYSTTRASNNYRKIEIGKKKLIKNFLKKKQTKKNSRNYIGLAGIYNFREFWNCMENNRLKSVPEGEVFGLNYLKKFGIKSYKYQWYDIGNIESYKLSLKKFKENKNNYNILIKNNECIWFNENIVIKYFKDYGIINKRVLRSKKLQGYIPKILNKKKHMYSYEKFDGEIFSRIDNKKIFLKLLSHVKKFNQIKINKKKDKHFQKKCMNFYKKKTFSRISHFYKKFKIKDNNMPINKSEKIYLRNIMKKIDWKYIADGVEGRFHGDLHFENILYSRKNKKFCFLDWRQDFDNSVKSGDVNYDLAKILHGLIVSHEAVKKDNFHINMKKKSHILIRIKNKKIYDEYLKIYFKWLKLNEYDVHKIKILTGLIFLNICGLHHYPYSIFLYYLGKKILIDELS